MGPLVQHLPTARWAQWSHSAGVPGQPAQGIHRLVRTRPRPPGRQITRPPPNPGLDSLQPSSLPNRRQQGSPRPWLHHELLRGWRLRKRLELDRCVLHRSNVARTLLSPDVRSGSFGARTVCGQRHRPCGVAVAWWSLTLSSCGDHESGITGSSVDRRWPAMACPWIDAPMPTGRPRYRIET